MKQWRWRIGSAVWICTGFWVYWAWMRWWGGVDWGGSGMWNVRVGMIGCRPVEMWWWRGLEVRVERGRLGMNVWRRIWRCLVCMLNGQCSGICGGASFREERLTLAERGKMDVLKINDDDDDDDDDEYHELFNYTRLYWTCWINFYWTTLYIIEWREGIGYRSFVTTSGYHKYYFTKININF